MGNRAIITTPQRELALYLHWNGGKDTIEPLLRYCKLKGYRDPARDDYGWARMAQVMGNFFGGTCSVGIMRYTTDEAMASYGDDNGVYIIEGWEIVDRIYPYEDFCEQRGYDPDEMMRALDAKMPEHDRLGAFLDAVEIAVEDVEIGDEVWLPDDFGWAAYPVIGFGQPEFNQIAVWVEQPDGKVDVTYPPRPYVARFDHGGDYSWNCNNYPNGKTAFINPRKEESDGEDGGAEAGAEEVRG